MTHTPPTTELLGGRYRLETRLGGGGAGEVWQGRHAALGATVAIKLLRPGRWVTGKGRQRFLNEARVMARLDSQHVVKVHDVGVSSEGAPFLVMDLVDGESLGEKLQRERRLSAGTVARLLGQVARGLERAHAQGVVHRDLKPANVLLSVDEEGALRARVTDFGMAKLLRALEPEGAAVVGEERVGGEAATGMAGTPYYMAPEQFRGEAVGPQTDVWAFGVMAYECLVGRRPFVGETAYEVSEAVMARRFRPASQRGVASAFDAWFERACAAEPARRFEKIRFAAEALAEALGVAAAVSWPGGVSSSRVPSRRPVEVDPLARTAEAERAVALGRRRWREVGIVVAGLGLGVLGGWLVQRSVARERAEEGRAAAVRAAGRAGDEAVRAGDEAGTPSASVARVAPSGPGSCGGAPSASSRSASEVRWARPARSTAALPSFKADPYE